MQRAHRRDSEEPGEQCDRRTHHDGSGLQSEPPGRRVRLELASGSLFLLRAEELLKLAEVHRTRLGFRESVDPVGAGTVKQRLTLRRYDHLPWFVGGDLDLVWPHEPVAEAATQQREKREH